MTQDAETVARLEALAADSTIGREFDWQVKVLPNKVYIENSIVDLCSFDADCDDWAEYVAATMNTALPLIRSLSARLAAAEARVRELEYALHPMKRGAREADYYCGHDVPGDHEVLITVSIEELRAARAALQPGAPDA